MKLFRLVRFRLRTLLALVTLVSALLGYYVYTANQYAREMAAIEKLHQLTGGSFWLLLRLDENVLFSGEPPAVAALLDWQGPALLRAPMKRWNAPIFYRCVQLDLQTDVFDDTSIPAIALLHSARAARHFATLCERAPMPREKIRLAALAPLILAAAGEGWDAGIAADTPDDMALLAAAARLCQ